MLSLTNVGMLILSPVSMAPVCHVGDPLQLTCTADVEFIRWNLTVVNEHGVKEDIVVSRNSRDSASPQREITINSTTFTFSRTSVQGDLPLVSVLAISSTSFSLNGTVVQCMDASNSMTMLVPVLTTIQIIDISPSKLAISGTIVNYRS